MKGRERDDVLSMMSSADLDFSINVAKTPVASKEKIRQIFDNISLNVISLLENHRGVTDVKFFERAPVTHSQISEWEKKYAPYKLPDDYKSFLLISDGFVLKWHMKYNREVLPLGYLSLSPLQTVKPIKKPNDDRIAFSLDGNNSATDGNIAIIFDSTDSENMYKSSIWFEDLSCEWNFVCYTFSDYLRLMIMHLGLPNWQYAFTKVGLNPITRQWLRFLVPNRLDMDLRHNANGFGWLLPMKPTKHKKHGQKLKRKKLSLNKIDQIVSAQLSKDSKAKINKLLSSKNTSVGNEAGAGAGSASNAKSKSKRPVSAPNHAFKSRR